MKNNFCFLAFRNMKFLFIRFWNIFANKGFFILAFYTNVRFDPKDLDQLIHEFLATIHTRVNRESRICITYSCADFRIRNTLLAGPVKVHLCVTQFTVYVRQAKGKRRNDEGEHETRRRYKLHFSFFSSLHPGFSFVHKCLLFIIPNLPLYFCSTLEQFY